MIGSVSITREEITAEQLDFLVSLTNSSEPEKTTAILLERLEDYQLLTKHRTDLNGVLFSEIKTWNDLDRFVKLHDALALAVRYSDYSDNFMDFLKQDTRYLGLTVNDVCDKYQRLDTRCVHCASGESKGKVMDFDKLTEIDPEFFQLFEEAAFGRKGEPFLYRSNGHDLTDVVEFVARTGIEEISFYFGVFDKNNPQYVRGTERLIQFKEKNPDIKLATGFTYHPFAPDRALFEEGFKYGIDSCFQFSDELVIELLASEVSEEISMKRLEEDFEGFKERLFGGYIVNEGNVLEKDGRRVTLRYKGPNTSVYDTGDFTTTLEVKGLTDRYLEVMGPKTYPPICVSTLNHEFIVIEPDGGIKTCVSFDGMHTKAQVNIFEVGYKGVVEWLEERFHQQRIEVLEKLPELMYAKHNMCDCR